MVSDPVRLKPTQPSRLWAPDLLRGLSALGVVGWHYLLRAPLLYPQLGQPNNKWADWLQHCLLLFFIISGYFIFDSVRASGAKRFFANRAIRLYPTYWLAVILTFTVVTTFGLPGRETSLEVALFNLTMIQRYFGVLDVDGVYWTLAVELMFYLVIATLAHIGALDERRIYITLFAWLAATAVARVVGATVIADYPRIHIFIGIAREMPLFIIGIALNLGRKTGRWALSAAVIVVAIAVRAPGNVSGIIPMIVTTLMMLIALYLTLPGRMNNAAIYLADYLSELSYPLYLVHMNVGLVIMLALASHGMPYFGAIAITLAIVISISTTIAYAIDIPVRRNLRARLRERYPNWR